MDLFIKVTSSMENIMDKEQWFTQMADPTLVTGLKANNMDTVFRHSSAANQCKVNGPMARE